MLSVSSFFSIDYLALFLPPVILMLTFPPQKVRRWLLLAANYTLFWAFSGKLIAYLLAITVAIYYFGLWLSSIQKKRDALLKETPKEEKKTLKAVYLKKQRYVLALGILLVIGTLICVKYTAFFATNINSLLGACGASFRFSIPKIAAPIGISFFTFQAASYLFDVYRQTVSADKNILRVALFMSFFPQIMEGPIIRYSETADQLWNIKRVKWNNFTLGSQRIIFGLMKKIVVADRLNLFIKNVYEDYGKYDGFVIALVAIAYTVQLYMDFSGTMDVVMGSGQILGITLPENFKRPFFSVSISEFWKRWHITLGAWFRDYIFYPLSMSKPLKKLTSKARKKLGNHFGPLIAGAIALFCVWSCNGLWHGAGWQYIFFGMYHFAFILLGNIFDPYFEKLASKLHIKRSVLPYKIFRIVRTALLVCIGELFFRAESLSQGMGMFKKIFTDFSFATIRNGKIFQFGLDEKDFIIVGITLMLILVIGILQERGHSIRAEIATKNIVIRFAIIYALIMFIVIFGAYGVNYVPVDPMYAEF